MKRCMMVLAAGFVLLAYGAAPAIAAKGPVINDCVTCHEKVSPQIVKDWKECKMSGLFACDKCHGKEHNTMTDFAKAKMPTADTCKPCHGKQVEQFNNGKHSLAWVALQAMPKTGSQPHQIMEGMKGCGGCHRIGYQGGKCDSCHTRHKFSKAEAQKPEACGTCHMGFDHPQYEMWGTSKHGMIYAMEGDTGRAPKCQTCHMDGGDHGVMTSWGFLALRLPEDDAAWMADRVTILQALNVLDDKGQPTGRLDVVKAGKVARLTKEEWQGPRDKMIKVCSNCHSGSFVKKNLQAADEIIKEADKLMAEAIRTVDGLYKDGILERPKDAPFSVDLLTFYDAPTAIEQTLYVMLLEHRMRTFQGAFHMNPDYMHWYGWAEMKKDLVEIKEEAAKLRAEHGK
ncbi:MAG: cytochrome C [Nitrospirae bacterium]|nr:cytochrome C [Nitrospirota bacterium]